ncbi:MAG: hypothetical protein ACTHN5_06755 [Phycisphaerae bacterium]
MLHQFNTLLFSLGQVDFDDFGSRKPPPAPPHRLSFGDLQKGLQSTNEGTPGDRRSLYILLTMVALIAVLAFILQLRERKKNAGPLNSPFRLGCELSRKIRFPFGTRLLLAWAARSAELPMATLLISLRAFDDTITNWSRQPTFTVIRRWGYKRLKLLRPQLFEAAPVAGTAGDLDAKTGAPQSTNPAAHH